MSHLTKHTQHIILQALFAYLANGCRMIYKKVMQRYDQAAAEMYLTKQRLAIGSSVSSIGKLKDVSITYTAGLGRSAFFFIKSPFICS